MWEKSLYPSLVGFLKETGPSGSMWQSHSTGSNIKNKELPKIQRLSTITTNPQLRKIKIHDYVREVNSVSLEEQ